jgi:hypothetical protein
MACAPAGAQTPRRVTIILGSQQVEVTHPGLDLAAKLAGMAIYD